MHIYRFLNRRLIARLPFANTDTPSRAVNHPDTIAGPGQRSSSASIQSLFSIDQRPAELVEEVRPSITRQNSSHPLRSEIEISADSASPSKTCELPTHLNLSASSANALGANDNLLLRSPTVNDHPLRPSTRGRSRDRPSTIINAEQNSERKESEALDTLVCTQGHGSDTRKSPTQPRFRASLNPGPGNSSKPHKRKCGRKTSILAIDGTKRQDNPVHNLMESWNGFNADIARESEMKFARFCETSMRVFEVHLQQRDDAVQLLQAEKNELCQNLDHLRHKDSVREGRLQQLLSEKAEMLQKMDDLRNTTTSAEAARKTTLHHLSVLETLKTSLEADNVNLKARIDVCRDVQNSHVQKHANLTASFQSLQALYEDHKSSKQEYWRDISDEIAELKHLQKVEKQVQQTQCQLLNYQEKYAKGKAIFDERESSRRMMLSFDADAEMNLTRHLSEQLREGMCLHTTTW